MQENGAVYDNTSRRSEAHPFDVSNTSSIRSQGQGQSQQPQYPTQIVSRETIESEHGRISDFWKVEPNMGRVANGVSGRVDRLKQLGNAVVPQIPEMIGRAILAAERSLV